MHASRSLLDVSLRRVWAFFFPNKCEHSDGEPLAVSACLRGSCDVLQRAFPGACGSTDGPGPEEDDQHADRSHHDLHRQGDLIVRFGDIIDSSEQSEQKVGAVQCPNR